MLFNINKRTSLALIHLTGALSFLLIPAFLNMLSLEAAVYFSFTAFMFVAALRVKENLRISFSIQHSIYAALIIFGVISLLWSKNISRHLLYMFSVASVLAFSIVMKEYFSENSSGGFKRRFCYFVSVSGFICAAVNIAYWLIYIVPYAVDAPFREGLATSDFLGIFMSLSIACTACLFKNNSKIKKALIVIAILMMLFVALMTKSSMVWFFSAALISLAVIKKKIKSTKNYTLISSVVVVIYFVALLLRLNSTLDGKAFSDVFGYFFKNIFGAGGGFWSGKETFSRFSYSNEIGVGLLPYLSAAAGVIGLVSCLILIIRSVIVFIKLKTIESAVGLLLLLTVMLLPLGNSISAILFLAGITVYNENLTDTEFKYTPKESLVKKASISISVVLIISAFLTLLSFVKMNAYSAFENGQYNKSYEMYRIVSSLNFTDSESCAMAALSIYEDETLLESKKEEATSLINKAIKGDRLNLENIEIKAKIYYSTGQYDLCAQEYRNISSKTAIKDKYNLSLAEALFKIVEENPKGSSETKRAYEEIVEIAQGTDNLDLRKEINDLAEKAYPRTKGDLTNERENMAQ